VGNGEGAPVGLVEGAAVVGALVGVLVGSAVASVTNGSGLGIDTVGLDSLLLQCPAPHVIAPAIAVARISKKRRQKQIERRLSRSLRGVIKLKANDGDDDLLLSSFSCKLPSGTSPVLV